MVSSCAATTCGSPSRSSLAVPAIVPNAYARVLRVSPSSSATTSVLSRHLATHATIALTLRCSAASRVCFELYCPYHSVSTQRLSLFLPRVLPGSPFCLLRLTASLGPVRSRVRVVHHFALVDHFAHVRYMSSRRSTRNSSAGQQDYNDSSEHDSERGSKQRHEDDKSGGSGSRKLRSSRGEEKHHDSSSSKQSQPSHSHSSKSRNHDDAEHDDSDNEHNSADKDADNNTDTYYDAKHDEGQTQVDLHVDKDDPTSKKSLDAVHDQTKHERTTGDTEEEQVNPQRIRIQRPSGDLDEFNEVSVRPNSKAVLYWMQREQRLEDNWALLYAAEVAEDAELPLMVVFCMVPKFLDATERQYGWMIRGMQELEGRFREKGIHFEVLLGYSYDLIPDYVEKHKIGVVINDLNPLRCHREWCKLTATHTGQEGRVRVPCGRSQRSASMGGQ